jgi:hypothetical protein
MMQDLLIVTYDAQEGDSKTLCVGRPEKDGSHTILNMMLDDKAEATYMALTGKRGKRNIDVIRSMCSYKLMIFLNDVFNYENPNHEWASEIQPPLPFESWEDWLLREANYG